MKELNTYMQQRFIDVLDGALRETKDKNIIIYGYNDGGDYVRWFYEKYYAKKPKAWMDRWELTKGRTILHLWALYYIYDADDVIINVTPYNIIDEFNDTGEDWTRTYYRETQIINLWHLVYPNERNIPSDYRQITYFDWLNYHTGDKLDLLNTIKRAHIGLNGAHGYFPVEPRALWDCLAQMNINNTDRVIDFGCGKGSAILSLLAAGFHHVAGIEYNRDIFQQMAANFDVLQQPYTVLNPVTSMTFTQEKTKEDNASVHIYCGDARDLNTELDDYNWFYLFNPFSWEITLTVLTNIYGSLYRKPRKVYLLLWEPIVHRLIVESSRFHLYKTFCGDYADCSCYLYLYESI